jgi:hypothetical protein
VPDARGSPPRRAEPQDPVLAAELEQAVAADHEAMAAADRHRQIRLRNEPKLKHTVPWTPDNAEQDHVQS